MFIHTHKYDMTTPINLFELIEYFEKPERQITFFLNSSSIVKTRLKISTNTVIFKIFKYMKINTRLLRIG
jgi:hypothetical protein